MAEETFTDVQPVQQPVGGATSQETFSDVQPVAAPHGVSGSWEPNAPETYGQQVAGRAKKVVNAATAPLLPAGRAEKEGEAYADSAPTIAESNHPIMTGIKKGVAGAYGDTMKNVRGMFTSPVGIATLGAGGLAAEGAESVPTLAKAAGTVSKVAGLGFGAQGAHTAYQGGRQIAQNVEDTGGLSLNKETAEGAEKLGTGAGMVALTGAAEGRGTDLGETPVDTAAGIKKLATIPVRGAAKAYNAARNAAPYAIPAIGAAEGLMHGGPIGAVEGAAAGTWAGNRIQKLMPEASETTGLSKEDSNLREQQKAVKPLQKALDAAQKEHDSYAASEAAGEPIPEKVVAKLEKAKAELTEQQKHLDLAEQAAANAKAGRANAAPPQSALAKVPTPAERPAARTGEALGGPAMKSALQKAETPAATRASESGEALANVKPTQAGELAAKPPTGAESEPGYALGNIKPTKASSGIAKEPGLVGSAYTPPAPAAADVEANDVATEDRRMAEAPEPKTEDITAKPAAPPEPKPVPERGGDVDTAKNDNILWQRAKGELNKELGREPTLGEINDRTTKMKAAPEQPKYRRPDMSATEGLTDTMARDKELATPQRRAGDVKPEAAKESPKGYSEAKHEEYAAAVKANPQAVTLSDPEGMKNNKIYSNGEGAYYSISPEGDLQGVINNSGKKGVLASAVPDAIANGAKTLDAWDIFLPEQYEKYGFERTKLEPYDVSQFGEPSEQLKDGWRQQGWRDGEPYPGVQYMKLKEAAAPAAEAPKAEAEKPAEEPKANSEETKAQPEDVNRVQKLVKDLRDQKLATAGKQYDLDHEGYDWRHQGEKRVREGRNQFSTDLANKVPPDMVEKLLKAQDDWDNKDSGTFSSQDRSGASRAERAEAIWDKAHEEGFGKESAEEPKGGTPTDAEVAAKFSAKGPAPAATAETAKMSNEELLKHGFTQEDIDAGLHLPKAGGGKEGVTALPEALSKHLTEDEIKGLTTTEQARNKAIKNVMKVPDIQEFTDIALKGEAARKWYQRSRQAISAVIKALPEYFKEPGDTEKFTNFLAAGSPQQSVKMNLQETLRAWTKYVDEGRPEGPELERLLTNEFTMSGGKVPNAMKALAGEEMWPDISKNSAFKVPSFGANLLGWLKHVTNDGWQGLFAGIEADDLSDPASYHPLAAATRAAAEALGWEPAEAQAAIWAFTKAFTEGIKKGMSVEEAGDSDYVAQYSRDFADMIANDPDIQDQLGKLGVNKETLNEHLAKVEAKPKVTARTTPSTPDSVARLNERIRSARTIPSAKDEPLQENLGFNTEELTGPKPSTVEFPKAKENLGREPSTAKQRVEQNVAMENAVAENKAKAAAAKARKVAKDAEKAKRKIKK